MEIDNELFESELWLTKPLDKARACIDYHYLCGLNIAGERNVLADYTTRWGVHRDLVNEWLVEFKDSVQLKSNQPARQDGRTPYPDEESPFRLSEEEIAKLTSKHSVEGIDWLCLLSPLRTWCDDNPRKMKKYKCHYRFLLGCISREEGRGNILAKHPETGKWNFYKSYLIKKGV